MEPDMATEATEHARTTHALKVLSGWGHDPGSDGGENIAFSLVRQGGVSDVLQVNGDCTPFTATGSRGVLHGQPTGDTGSPSCYTVDFSTVSPTVTQTPCTFEFDLNHGRVTLTGTFPGAPSPLSFHVELLATFDDPEVGDTVLFGTR